MKNKSPEDIVWEIKKKFSPMHKDADSLGLPSQSVITQRRGKYLEDASSQYVGVSFNKQSKKWTAKIVVNYKVLNLGRYEDEINAAKAYDKAALAFFGKNATTNFEYKEGEEP